MALVASNITAGYGGTPILRGVSCAIEPGAVTAILGPNGAGKTTLLRVLLGSLAARAGSVVLDGAPLSSIAPAMRARRLAFIPQATTPELPDAALEVVRLGRVSIPESPEQATRQARAALERVGLLDRGDEPLGTLSAGQQQRVLLARALAQLDACGPDGGSAEAQAGPPIQSPHHRSLLADEPVAAMDPRHALASMEVLDALARSGVGVGVVLHDFSLTARFAQRCVLLNQDGTVAFEGLASEAMRPEQLSSVFGVDFEHLSSASMPPIPVARSPMRP